MAALFFFNPLQLLNAATFLSIVCRDGCLVPPPIHPIVTLANGTNNKAKQNYNIDQGPVKDDGKAQKVENTGEPRSLLFHVIKRTNEFSTPLQVPVFFSAAVIHRHFVLFFAEPK